MHANLAVQVTVYLCVCVVSVKFLPFLNRQYKQFTLFGKLIGVITSHSFAHTQNMSKPNLIKRIAIGCCQ